jgi:hypothetical protein
MTPCFCRMRQAATPPLPICRTGSHAYTGHPSSSTTDDPLYPGNLIEVFAYYARPGLLAFLLLRMLDALKPRRLIGIIDTLGTWRVCACHFTLLTGAGAQGSNRW